MRRNDEVRSKGFLIFGQDWREFIQDYSPPEVVEMLLACFDYHDDGTKTEFEDKGLRMFFRNMVRSIDRQKTSYEDTCIQNAFNRYLGTCRNKGIEHLSRDDWYETIYLPKHPELDDMADERRRPLTGVTNKKIEYETEPEIETEEEFQIENEIETGTQALIGEKMKAEAGDRGVQGGKRREPPPLQQSERHAIGDIPLKSLADQVVHPLDNQGEYDIALPKDVEPVYQDYLKACEEGRSKEAVHLRCRLIDEFNYDPAKLMNTKR